MHGYVETACVTMTLFVSTDKDTDGDDVDQLDQTFDSIVQLGGNALSAKATHATQTLIWKASGMCNANLADKWCVLLRHPLFDNAGQINKARIGR